MTSPRHQRGSWYANVINFVVRAVLFVGLLVAAGFIYVYLFVEVLSFKPQHFWAFLVIWLLTAYIVLPRINRLFTTLYLPNYFIGRSRTADGLLGDPVNLALRGTRQQLVNAMEQAGWTQAEPLNFRSSLKMIYAAVRGRNYKNAPVSSLFLFNNQQDLAFQKQIGGNPRKRHHVRFWKTPDNWWLPGGYKADWLGAATYDKHVAFSLYTGQITHKIDADVDVERDFVLDSLRKAKVTRKIKIVKHFTPSFTGRNGEGHPIHTDGSLPFIDL